MLKVYVFRLEFFQRGGKTERPEKMDLEWGIDKEKRLKDDMTTFVKKERDNANVKGVKT